MRCARNLLIATVICIAPARLLFAQTVTIPNTDDDTYIAHHHPADNYDDEGQLYLGAIGAGSEYNVLLDFDISTLQANYPPSDWEVTDAEIDVYQFGSVSAPATMTLRTYLIDTSWNESTVTWDTGETYGIDVYTPVVGLALLSPSNGYHSIDVTDTVQQWSSSNWSGSYHGFLISMTSPSSGYIKLYDYESNEYNKWPTLDIWMTYIGCDCTDNDGDGYGSPGDPCCPNGGATDCNDGNASVHPNANESCNNIDDDCDGQIDEGFDNDNDGYTTCENDCNDNNAGVHPGATEVCDNIDNNCNGQTDEGGVCDCDCNDWDGDGYYPTNCNDPNCDNTTDCDDYDSNTHPGAPEGCNGEDNDCNGSPGPLEADNDNDGWMLCEDDCDDNNPNVNPGEQENCFNGIDDNCDGQVNEGCGDDDDDDTGDDDTGDDDTGDDDTGDDDDDDDNNHDNDDNDDNDASECEDGETDDCPCYGQSGRAYAGGERECEDGEWGECLCPPGCYCLQSAVVGRGTALSLVMLFIGSIATVLRRRTSRNST